MMISFRYLALLVFLFMLVGGCGKGGDSNTVNVDQEKSNGAFPMPGAIQTTAINLANLSAFLIIDDGVNTPRREAMTISNGSASFSAPLSPGTYTFTMEFEYNGTDGNGNAYSEIKLAIATKADITLTPGVNNNIEFLDSDYGYPDDDDDGVYNIIELELGNSPINQYDTPPLSCSVDQGIINCVPVSYTISGALIGLQGGGLLLRNNGGDDLALTQNGSFTFQAALQDGSAYDVTVEAQPTNPNQNCVVSNSSGTVSGANITSVIVNCQSDTYTIGGVVAGLVGDGLILQLNDGNDLAISSNGLFAFPVALVDGSTYSVSVLNQPAGLSQTCSVSNGNGTLNGANVENISIQCNTNSFTIGGSISLSPNGVNGSGLVLQLNDSNNLTINPGDNSFTFATSLLDGSNYNVTILSQPTSPSQRCTVSNNSGVLSGADITNLNISCVNTYSVGGTVSGLEGDSVVLQLNGSETLTVNLGETTFTFSTLLDDGSAYTVSVLASPTNPDQVCTVVNGESTIAGVSVTNVSVNCTTPLYSISGVVEGLQGSVVLQNNGVDDLPLDGSGTVTFIFNTFLPNGSDYNVTILSQPAGQVCTVNNGVGTINGGDISNVSITCASGYSVGVTVSGYTTGNTMVLTNNNGADNISLTNDGFYTFGALLQNGDAYNVTIVSSIAVLKTNCIVGNATGAIVGTNVTDITVTCTDDITPNIISTTPVNSSINAPVDTTISATFDEDMLTTSFAPDTISLTDSFGGVDGVSEYNVFSRTLSFSPTTTALALLMPYTATVPNTIADVSGNTLVGTSWTFTTGDGAWGGTQVIDPINTQAASRPHAALDPLGNGMVVWNQSNATQQSIWASRLDRVSNSWGAPQLIEFDDTGYASSPRVVLDSVGNAIAVWYQNDGIRDSIWANSYDALSDTWGVPELLETDDAGTAWGVEIALDTTGNAIAVWHQNDGTRYNIWANRYDGINATWETAQLIEGDDQGHAQNPKIAFDPAGNAIVVWHHWDGTRYNIWANRFDATNNTWDVAQLIETDDLRNALDPRVAMDPAGNAIVVWHQSDGVRNNILYNRYDIQSNTWAVPQLLETNDLGDAWHPQIASDSSGNVMVVWYQSDGNVTKIWAKRFVGFVAAWDPAQTIEEHSVGNAASPRIALDPAGNGLVIWYHWDGSRYNMWSNRFNGINNMWGTAQLIENDLGTTANPEIIMNSLGQGIAVWDQSDGTSNNIISNRFE